MTTSMLRDFVYCQEAGVSGRELGAFLAIREDLRRALLRQEGMDEVLSRLADSGLWARIYSATDLIAITRSGESSDDVLAAQRILLGLVGTERDTLRSRLEAAIRDATSGSNGEDTFRSLEAAAEDWLTSEDQIVRTSHRLDYSDVEAFVVPALILALAMAVGGDTDAAAPHGGALISVAERALAGPYGRLAFNLAVDWALAAPTLIATETVGHILLSLPVDRVLASPDLLRHFGQWTFLAGPSAKEPAEALAGLQNELLGLWKFRSFFGDAPRVDVGVVLWQNTLIEMMLDVDVDAGARAISQWWIPRILRPELHFRIDIAVGTVSSDLRRLHAPNWIAPVGDRRGDPEMRAVPRATPADAWSILSPYLAERTWAKHTTPHRLRWLCGLFLDLRVLERRDFDDVGATFAIHLLSSLPLLRQYGNFSGPRDIAAWRSDVSRIGHLGWLSRQALISGLSALDGFGRVRCDDLLLAIEDACAASPSIGNLAVADLGEKLPDFRRRITTGALRLIESAIGAVGSAAQSPWIQAAERIIAWHAELIRDQLRPQGSSSTGRDVDSSDTSDELILYGLIRRYLAPDSVTPVYVDHRILDLVHNSGSGEGSWAVSSRRLLLAPEDDAAMWVGPGDDKGNPTIAIKVARALMRVSAAVVDTNVSGVIRRQWRDELYRLLSEISDPVYFDRFARLKLIRMVAQGVFEGDAELVVAVAKSLLLFGGPFHVGAILKAISGGGLASARDVAVAVFAALERFASSSSSSTAPQLATPKEQMLDQLRLACLVADDEVYQYITSAFRTHGGGDGRLAIERAGATLRASGSGVYMLSKLDSPDPWISPATAEMVAVDPTSAEAVILHRRRSTLGDTNVFAVGQEGYHASRRLGIVEASSRGPHGTTVRIDPDRLVNAPTLSDEPPELGELVVVDMGTGQAVDDRPRSSGRRLQPLPLHQMGQDRAKVALVSREGQTPRVVVRLPSHGELDWTRQTYNFVGLYRETEREYEIPLSPLSRAGDMRSAAVRRLPDLLVDYPELYSGGPITLCIHDVGRTTGGDIEYVVVETRPFQRYVIWARLGFTEHSCVALSSEIARLHQDGIGPEGLLISVCLARSMEGAALELSMSNVADQLSGSPSPFDLRNLIWRERFFVSLDGTASQQRSILGPFIGRSKTRWRFLVEVPTAAGFPSDVDVILDERCDKASPFIEVDPATWDAWEATVHGSVVEDASLRLPERDHIDRAEAVRSLGSLRIGAAVTVSRVTEFVRDDGRVLAFSDTNLPVLLDAETITLRVPCEPKRRWASGRRAEITRAEWRPSGFRGLVRLSDVPSEAVAGGRAKGLITRLAFPVPDDQLACTVAWLHRDGVSIVEQPMVLQLTRTGRRLWQGSMIDMSMTEGEEIAILEPFVVASGTWALDAEDRADVAASDDYFVGSLAHRGETWDAYETGPGTIALRRIDAHRGARGVVRKQFSLAEEDDDIPVVDITRDRSRDRIWSGGVRRCVLRFGETGVFAGVTSTEVVGGPARLSGLQLVLRGGTRPGDWLVARTCHIRPDRRGQIAGVRLIPAASDSMDDEVPELRLDDIVTGRFDARGFRLHLRGKIRQRYPDGVRARSDSIQRGPRTPETQFPETQARARIVSLDPPLASFTEAPESSLEDLALALESARDGGSPLAIDQRRLRLVFVGTEEGSRGGERRYLFEWGYGFWLGLDEAHLRYANEPIETAKLLLFYGDRISAAEVTEDSLLIEGIAPSRAHALYRQSRDHKIINLLRLTSGPDGEPVIEAIMGFDPEFERQDSGGALPHARLDAEGLRRVQSRLGEKSLQRVLARLDTSIFEATSGREVLFRFRRLDLADSEFGIQEGDRVLLSAGSIRLTANGNDLGLEMYHPGLHQHDVSPDFAPERGRGQLILRRAFSIRQQALWDLFRLEGAKRLQGNLLLVRLSSRGPSLVEGSLPRNPEVIRQRLRQGHELLAVFGGAKGNDWLFELGPGVSVGLRKGEVHRGEEFMRGDVVVLRPSEGESATLELASPSDDRFIRDGRPVVILPHDTLAREESLPPYPNRKIPSRLLGAFSVGDLPDLRLAMRQRHLGGGTRQLTEDEFVEFMCTPHPRVGALVAQQEHSKDDVLGHHVVPGVPPGTIAGRLMLRQEDASRPPKPFVVQGHGAEEPKESDWCFLTYSDRSAAVAATSAAEALSEFHDSSTPIWKRAPTASFRVERRPLKPFAAVDGPLFFSLGRDGRALLRHPRRELSKYISGPSTLMPLLAHGRPIEVTVVTSRVDGLVVETSPGRFAELPAGMLRFAATGGSRPMRTVDLRVFDAGDLLTLSFDRSADALGALVLEVTWRHSNYNALGPAGALLELNAQASDPVAGTAVYGAGNFQIAVPSCDVAALPALAAVGGDGVLSVPSPENSISKNQTVLVVLDTEGRLRIHGLTNTRFVPDRNWPWDQDFLFERVVKRKGDMVAFVKEELVARLTLSGGALPFTVEGVARENLGHLIFLSLRNQTLSSLEGHVLRAEVEGQVGDSGPVQLRVGGRRFGMAMEGLVPGLESHETAAVRAALQEGKLGVWLTKGQAGYLRGFGYSGKENLIVAPLKVVTQATEFFGVLCEGLSDGRIYWLPAKESSAYPYPASAATQVFSTRQMQRLKVTLLSSGVVSILRQPAAKSELQRMRPGTSIFVDVLDVTIDGPTWAPAYDSDKTVSWVCVSKQSSLSFALAAPELSVDRKSLRVDVAARLDSRSTPSIVVVPAGERLVATETPSWLFAEDPPSLVGDGVAYLPPSSEIDGLPRIVDALRHDLPEETAPDLAKATRAFVAAEWVSVVTAAGLSAALASRSQGDPDIQDAQVHLLSDLFARALRSPLLEVLGTWALRPPGEVSAFTAWRRSELVEHLRGGNLDAARLIIDRWLTAIDLEGVKAEEDAFANALGLLVGRSTHPETVMLQAPFLQRIIAATRPIALASAVDHRTAEMASRRVRDVGSELVERQLDIPLFPALRFARTVVGTRHHDDGRRHPRGRERQFIKTSGRR